MPALPFGVQQRVCANSVFKFPSHVRALPDLASTSGTIACMVLPRMRTACVCCISVYSHSLPCTADGTFNKPALRCSGLTVFHHRVCSALTCATIAVTLPTHVPTGRFQLPSRGPPLPRHCPHLCQPVSCMMFQVNRCPHSVTLYNGSDVAANTPTPCCACPAQISKRRPKHCENSQSGERLTMQVKAGEGP